MSWEAWRVAPSNKTHYPSKNCRFNVLLHAPFCLTQRIKRDLGRATLWDLKEGGMKARSDLASASGAHHASFQTKPDGSPS